MKKLTFTLILFSFLGLALTLKGQPCTLVIGYSQVGFQNGGWFHAGPNGNSNFESEVGDDKWELLWNGGGGVDLWKDPNYQGWNNVIESPCLNNSNSPIRVLLSVSGPHEEDVPAWVADIQATISTIRSKYPSVRSIILQAVVGGPNHQICFNGVDSVRASWQHPYIDDAIAQVAATDFRVQVGYSPEVLNCGHYIDSKGHLTIQGARVAGTLIGSYYKNNFPGKTNEEGLNPSETYEIYPNPGQGDIRIGEDVEKPYQVKVIDPRGKVVFDGWNVSTVDLTNFPSGLYVVQCLGQSSTKHFRYLLNN